MLDLRHIHVTLSKNTHCERPLFSDLNLQVKRGEWVMLVGDNGAGKSSLLRVVSGQLLAHKGSVVIDGQDVTRRPNHQRASLVAQVFQDPQMSTIENMSIEENLCFAYLRGKKRSLMPYKSPARRLYFKEKLSFLQMGLEERLNEKVANLSGGQRQALSLMMALVCEAKVLLLDEITAALDPKMASLIMDLAAKMIKISGYTALMVTHHMAHAIRYGERIVLLKEGKIAAEISGKEKSGLTQADLTLMFNAS